LRKCHHLRPASGIVALLKAFALAVAVNGAFPVREMFSAFSAKEQSPDGLWLV
jgi:hypothetical protein